MLIHVCETFSVTTAAVEAWFCSEEVHVWTRRSHFHPRLVLAPQERWCKFSAIRALEAGPWTSKASPVWL